MPSSLRIPGQLMLYFMNQFKKLAAAAATESEISSRDTGMALMRFIRRKRDGNLSF
jgi:hypothetical protein